MEKNKSKTKTKKSIKIVIRRSLPSRQLSFTLETRSVTLRTFPNICLRCQTVTVIYAHLHTDNQSRIMRVSEKRVRTVLLFWIYIYYIEYLVPWGSILGFFSDYFFYRLIDLSSETKLFKFIKTLSLGAFLTWSTMRLFATCICYILHSHYILYILSNLFIIFFLYILTFCTFCTFLTWSTMETICYLYLLHSIQHLHSVQH